MAKLEDQLSLLGRKTEYKQDYAPEVLEAFDNKHPENDYWVRFNCPEFTSRCPVSVQPEFVWILSTGIFTPRGGISIYPYANYGRSGTKYEEMAMHRLMNHE